MQSEEASADIFRRFVGTFTPTDRPELAFIAGGEAFLRPALLEELAITARRSGCRSAALSGMYWARGGRIPASIRRAIDALDHFSASVDVFHEREVPREDVLRVIEALLADGHDVSIHVVGLDGRDPYLQETTDDIRQRFDDRVPMLCNGINPIGRAAEWFPLPEYAAPARVEPFPCSLSAWPVIGYDGTILACGNDDVLEGPAPDHLRIGHAATDGWPEVRERMLRSPMVRAVRTFGPEYVNERFGSGALACTGYCSTCQKLSGDGPLVQAVELAMSRPASKTVEKTVESFVVAGGARSFVQRFALPRYAELVTLGYPGADVAQPQPLVMVDP